MREEELSRMCGRGWGSLLVWGHVSPPLKDMTTAFLDFSQLLISTWFDSIQFQEAGDILGSRKCLWFLCFHHTWNLSPGVGWDLFSGLLCAGWRLLPHDGLVLVLFRLLLSLLDSCLELALVSSGPSFLTTPYPMHLISNLCPFSSPRNCKITASYGCSQFLPWLNNLVSLFLYPMLFWPLSFNIPCLLFLWALFLSLPLLLPNSHFIYHDSLIRTLLDSTLTAVSYSLKFFGKWSQSPGFS